MFLFCYGSLEFDEVMREVTGRTFAGVPAWLDGFARYRVRDADYPGLLPEPGACTQGTLYRGVDDAALATLDRFEGPLYERRLLEVGIAGGERRPANVYVVREAQRDLLTREPWDERAFARDRLEAFLRRIRVG